MNRSSCHTTRFRRPVARGGGNSPRRRGVERIPARIHRGGRAPSPLGGTGPAGPRHDPAGSGPGRPRGVVRHGFRRRRGVPRPRAVDGEVQAPGTLPAGTGLVSGERRLHLPAHPDGLRPLLPAGAAPRAQRPHGRGRGVGRAAPRLRQTLHPSGDPRQAHGADPPRAPPARPAHACRPHPALPLPGRPGGLHRAGRPRPSRAPRRLRLPARHRSRRPVRGDRRGLRHLRRPRLAPPLPPARVRQPLGARGTHRDGRGRPDRPGFGAAAGLDEPQGPPAARALHGLAGEARRPAGNLYGLFSDGS